jgi:hypothetical protein
MLVTFFPCLWHGICTAFTAELAENAEKGGNRGKRRNGTAFTAEIAENAENGGNGGKAANPPPPFGLRRAGGKRRGKEKSGGPEIGDAAILRQAP